MTNPRPYAGDKLKKLADTYNAKLQAYQAKEAAYNDLCKKRKKTDPKPEFDWNSSLENKNKALSDIENVLDTLTNNITPQIEKYIADAVGKAHGTMNGESAKIWRKAGREESLKPVYEVKKMSKTTVQNYIRHRVAVMMADTFGEEHALIKTLPFETAKQNSDSLTLFQAELTKATPLFEKPHLRNEIYRVMKNKISYEFKKQMTDLSDMKAVISITS